MLNTPKSRNLRTIKCILYLSDILLPQLALVIVGFATRKLTIITR